MKTERSYFSPVYRCTSLHNGDRLKEYEDVVPADTLDQYMLLKLQFICGDQFSELSNLADEAAAEEAVDVLITKSQMIIFAITFSVCFLKVGCLIRWYSKRSSRQNGDDEMDIAF